MGPPAAWATWSEYNMANISMDAPRTFLFEVVFTDIPHAGETQDPHGRNRSIIVEVDPDSIVETRIGPPSVEDARRFAKELAPQFAMQVVQKDLPHGFEPPYSVVEIDQLPRDLNLRTPKFQGDRFRAWQL
jgi:hypothetical protein